MKKTVKMTVHAGGGWDGHVVFTGTHPDNKELHLMESNLDSIKNFCEKHDLQMDENFLNLVTKNLSYSKYGLVVPILEIDENKPISSASHYLKTHFPDHY